VVTHVFSLPGEFLVKVTASNSRGDIGQTSVLIKVSTLVPTAKMVAGPLRGTAPLTVNFDASGSTSTGTITSYAWDFGDGSTATGVTASHTYANAGYYAAQLTVTDSNAGQSTASALVSVNAPVGTRTSGATQLQPTLPSAPQCAAGSGVMMLGSLAGLCVLMALRRRG
jgi:PKD repeat protein